MEEDFELVSKQELMRLREENNKLKSNLENAPKTDKKAESQKNVDQNKLISNIIAALHEESKKERELIIENLTEIKDLNKSTLDNLLTKTQELDSKLEDMIDTVSHLVESLQKIVEKLTNFGSDEIKEEIKKIQDLKLDKSLDKTNSKLEDIDMFLKNLKVLLSYVKPNDFILNMPSSKLENINASLPSITPAMGGPTEQKNPQTNNLPSSSSNQQLPSNKPQNFPNKS